VERNKRNSDFGTGSGETPSGQSPHSLMDDSVFNDVEDGKGWSSAHASTISPNAMRWGGRRANNPDERNVQTFLDSLPGKFGLRRTSTSQCRLAGNR